MAAINTLSNELILEICRCLTTKNLARLSLCSKQLYELAQPDLYFTFTQTHKRAIPALIRTLLAKPHLAQYVRTFNGHPFLQHHPTGWQIQITIEDDLRLRGALEELRVNWVRDEPGTVSSPTNIATSLFTVMSGRLNVVKDLKRTNQSHCQFWKKSTFD
jgi:hypothetical protein